MEDLSPVEPGHFEPGVAERQKRIQESENGICVFLENKLTWGNNVLLHEDTSGEGKPGVLFSLHPVDADRAYPSRPLTYSSEEKPFLLLATHKVRQDKEGILHREKQQAYLVNPQAQGDKRRIIPVVLEPSPEGGFQYKHDIRAGDLSSLYSGLFDQLVSSKNAASLDWSEESSPEIAMAVLMDRKNNMRSGHFGELSVRSYKMLEAVLTHLPPGEVAEFLLSPVKQKKGEGTVPLIEKYPDILRVVVEAGLEKRLDEELRLLGPKYEDMDKKIRASAVNLLFGTSTTAAAASISLLSEGPLMKKIGCALLAVFTSAVLGIAYNDFVELSTKYRQLPQTREALTGLLEEFSNIVDKQALEQGEKLGLSQERCRQAHMSALKEAGWLEETKSGFHT